VQAGLFSYPVHFKRMLYHGYRIRAARRWGKSKALVLLSCALPDTPASREQRPRFTCPEKRRENHKACLRVRSVSAQGGQPYGQAKTKDNMACLRGVATGGAEKIQGA